MRWLYRLTLAAIAIIVAFNLAYTLLAILAQGLVPGGAINALKYLPYPLLVAGLGAAAWYRWRESGAASFRDAPLEVKLATALLGWALVTVVFSSATLWQSLRGLNVDFAGLFLFLTVWLVKPEAKVAHRLYWLILGTLVVLAVLAIPESTANHAFRVWAGHDLSNHFVVNKIPQLRSLTSGPNPFGTLLVVLATLVAATVRRPAWRLVALVPVGVLLGLTFARSAWIGAAVADGGYFLYWLIRAKRFIWWPIVLGGAILVGASFGAIRYQEGILGVLLHGNSTEEHGQVAKLAIENTYDQNVVNTTVGHGLGTAGPVVFGTDEATKKDLPKIVESWYIQLIQEIGLIGFGLYMALYVLLIKRVLVADQLLGFLVIGLGVNAITLHTWAADANLNLMAWSLMALALFAQQLKPKRL